MSANNRTRIRLLYVEDHADTRELVFSILRDSAFEITAVSTFAEGLSLARARRFDVYLLDNKLPDGVGITLCREIRKFDAETPVIFCSGYTDGVHQSTARLAGAQAFITKPFDAYDLLSVIESVTQKSGRRGD